MKEKKKAGFRRGVRGISRSCTAGAKRKTNQLAQRNVLHGILDSRRIPYSWDHGDGGMLLVSTGCYIIQMISDTEELDWPSWKQNKSAVSFFSSPGKSPKGQERYSDCFVTLKPGKLVSELFNSLILKFSLFFVARIRETINCRSFIFIEELEIINIRIHSKTSTTDNIIYQLIIPEYLIFMKHNFKKNVIIIILAIYN